MSPRQCSADRLLALYKDQALSERAHHFLKGPLAVRPVFLKSNRRAAALVPGLLLGPLVYGLIEAEVRNTITPQRTIPGLLPENRAARPTAANIINAFTGLGFQRARTTAITWSLRGLLNEMTEYHLINGPVCDSAIPLS